MLFAASLLLVRSKDQLDSRSSFPCLKGAAYATREAVTVLTRNREPDHRSLAQRGRQSGEGENMSAPITAPSLLASAQVKKILYATDSSEASRKALPLVGAVAKKYGAAIYVANIWLPYSMGSPDAPVASEAEQFEDALAHTRKVSESPELAGLSTQVIVEEGDVGEEIARIVQQSNIDLVVVSTHGRTGWRRLVMGSVAESLFRNLSCPVLTAGPKLSERFSREFAIKRILFPTDFSEESRFTFPFFASLAAQNDSELVLAHVLPEETGTNPDTKRLAEPLRKDMEAVYAPYIEKSCRTEFVIDFGDAAQRIVDLVRTRHLDLIGMGVRNAPEFVTHFRNTVTYRVVLEAECPVLTHRAS